MSLRPELLAAVADARAHLARVDHEIREVERLRPVASDSPPDADRCLLIAAHLHALYTGVEAIIVRLLERFDGPPPPGPDSHRRTLAAAGLDVAGLRPAILSPASCTALHPFLGFRHFFRHAYGVALEWSRMEKKVHDAGAVFAAVRGELEAFLAFVERLALA